MDGSMSVFPVHPAPTPRPCSNSRQSSRWCHPTISSSVVPFSSCPQSLLASESFPMSQLFAWGSQSTGVSALALFPPRKSQGWSPSEWTGWISLQSKGLSRVFSNTTVQKHQFIGAQPSLWSNSHTLTWPLEEPELWVYRPLSAKWCLCLSSGGMFLAPVFLGNRSWTYFHGLPACGPQRIIDAGHPVRWVTAQETHLPGSMRGPASGLGVCDSGLQRLAHFRTEEGCFPAFVFKAC